MHRIGTFVLWVGVCVASVSDAATDPLEGRRAPDVPEILAAEPPRVPASITLPEALALALHHHPSLRADAWRVRAHEAEALQAGRRPNPELTLEAENVGGTGPLRGLDAAETSLRLAQVFELGGKRRARSTEAARRRDVAAWEYEVRRTEVLASTVRAFVAVLAAQERVALSDTLVSVAEQIRQSVSRRVATGGVSPIEERRARVAEETSRIQRDRSQRALDVARATLSASWGDAIPTFERALGRLDMPPDAGVPDLSVLVDGLRDAPLVAREGADVARYRAMERLAKASGAVDVTIEGGARYMNDADEGVFLIGASVPLPLFDRNRDGARVAERNVREAEARERAAFDRARLALVTAHAELLGARNEAIALGTTILPEAEAALSESREAYERGRLRLTDVLDTQRTTFELQERRVDVLATYHATVADIERLLGAPLEAAATKEP